MGFFRIRKIFSLGLGLVYFALTVSAPYAQAWGSAPTVRFFAPAEYLRMVDQYTRNLESLKIQVGKNQVR